MLPEERVLRRIHRNCYDSRLPVPIVRTAFEPNRGDVNGISVYREEFVSPKTLANSGPQPGQYYVARLGVGILKDGLNLSVVPDPQEDPPPGHALIPELNTATERQRSRELQRELAKLASRDIAHRPDAP